MVGTELLAAKRWPEVREGKTVGRRVELRDNLHAHRLGIADEVAHLLFRVAAVDGGKAGEEVALHAEGCLRLVPVVVVLVLEAVVIQVQLQRVHLIVGQDVDERIEVAHREELASAVEHHATHGVVGLVVDGDAGQEPLSDSACGDVVRLLHLNQRLRAPQSPSGRRGLDADALLADVEAVALLSEFLVGLHDQEDCIRRAFLCRRRRVRVLPRLAQIIRNSLQLGIIVGDLSEFLYLDGSLSGLHLLNGGNAERLSQEAE